MKIMPVKPMMPKQKKMMPKPLSPIQRSGSTVQPQTKPMMPANRTLAPKPTPTIKRKKI